MQIPVSSGITLEMKRRLKQNDDLADGMLADNIKRHAGDSTAMISFPGFSVRRRCASCFPSGDSPHPNACIAERAKKWSRCERIPNLRSELR
jgi:hypothetical protein